MTTSDDLLAEADELIRLALQFKAEVKARVGGYETCRGLTAEGLCSKAFGHEGECGLEVDGEPCPGVEGHPEPCREVGE